jgi:hypothetical protein
MKKYMLMVLALSLLIAAGTHLASAQIQGEIRVNVPFPFYVGNTQLPAGRYLIRRVEANNPAVLEIRSEDGKVAVLITGRDAQATSTPTKTELVFKKYGDVSILSQIFQAGTPLGVELPKLLQEERAAKGGATSERQSVEATSRKGATKGQ